MYALPRGSHVSPDELHETLRNLLDTKAVPSQENFVEGDAQQEPWKSLLHYGFVARRGGHRLKGKSISDVDRFQHTKEGMRQLQTGAEYTNSCPVFEVRAGLPLPQLTGYEMVRRLQLEGWSWRMMPKALRDLQGFAHSAAADGEKSVDSGQSRRGGRYGVTFMQVPAPAAIWSYVCECLSAGRGLHMIWTYVYAGFSACDHTDLRPCIIESYVRYGLTFLHVTAIAVIWAYVCACLNPGDGGEGDTE